MNINDYTDHLCDRFVLLSVAFLGLIGTSYILIYGQMASSSPDFDQFGISIQQTFSNEAADNYQYFINETKLLIEQPTQTNTNTDESILSSDVNDDSSEILISFESE